jgi:hypothetical protein
LRIAHPLRLLVANPNNLRLQVIVNISEQVTHVEVIEVDPDDSEALAHQEESEMPANSADEREIEMARLPHTKRSIPDAGSSELSPLLKRHVASRLRPNATAARPTHLALRRSEVHREVPLEFRREGHALG